MTKPLVRLTLKIVPGASQDKVVGRLGEALKLRVRAQPERGKANAAVIALLAQYLHVPDSAIQVVTGHTSSTKIVEIEGLTSTELHDKLSGL